MHCESPAEVSTDPFACEVIESIEVDREDSSKQGTEVEGSCERCVEKLEENFLEKVAIEEQLEEESWRSRTRKGRQLVGKRKLDEDGDAEEQIRKKRRSGGNIEVHENVRVTNGGGEKGGRGERRQCQPEMVVIWLGRWWTLCVKGRCCGRWWKRSRVIG